MKRSSPVDLGPNTTGSSSSARGALRLEEPTEQGVGACIDQTETDTEAVEEGTDTPIVEICDLTKRYGSADGTVTALSNVSLGIERGSITGLLGANGAGKSTLMKSVLGLVTPTFGTVRVRGVDVFEETASARRFVAAVLEGTRNVYWRLTARENVSFFAQLHGVPRRARPRRIERVVEAVGLDDRADVPVGDLSSGMKQRCALACALVRDTPVLLLDEPTLGLDREAKAELLAEFVELAARERRTIVLSSHDMDVIEAVCDRVVVIDDGSVVADGSIADLRAAFETRTYSITLEGDIAPVSTFGTEDTFEVRSWRRQRDWTQFETVLSDPDDVYELVARLRTRGVSLHSVNRAEADLGSIFAAVTDGKRATESATGATTESATGATTETASEGEVETATVHAELGHERPTARDR